MDGIAVLLWDQDGQFIAACDQHPQDGSYRHVHRKHAKLSGGVQAREDGADGDGQGLRKGGARHQGDDVAGIGTFGDEFAQHAECFYYIIDSL